MNKIKTALLTLSFALFFLVCSCGGNKYQTASFGGFGGQRAAFTSAQYPEYAVAYDEAIQLDLNDGAEGGEIPAQPAEAGQSRKLTKSAYLNLRVEDPAGTEKPLSALMEKYGAWPASTTIYENSRNYSIRVPSDSYDAMLAELAGLGRVTRRTENTEDVTLRYYDLEGRLAVKRELLNTYQTYLVRARNIDEIMTVESRIADLQQEIDWTGTQLRYLANLIDYSTVNVEITGPSGSSYSAPSLAERFGDFFGSFGEVFSTALVVIAGIIMYGVPALLVVILLYWLLFGRIGLVKKLWRLAARK
jgi:hypothetical protein